MKFLRFLVPRRLAPQLILLLLGALIFAQVVSLFVLGRERQYALADLIRDNALWKTVAAIKLIETTPDDLQQSLMKTISTKRTFYTLSDQPLVMLGEGDKRLEKMLERNLKQRLGSPRHTRVAVVYSDESSIDEQHSDYEWRSMSREGRRPEMNRHNMSPESFLRRQRWAALKGIKFYSSIQLRNGKWLNIKGDFKVPPQSFVPLLLPMAIMALLTIVIVWVSVYRLTRPLRTLESAANDLGRGANAKPLKEVGPAEVRAVTRSFNQMQERLTRFISDRTRMLAAISHDLRTPITSLRIRAEFIDDDDDRERMIATLDEMQAMVEETLAFTRDDSRQEEMRSLDLGGLLESIANDHEDMGHSVGVTALNRVVLKCRPISLKRAFQNLISNAIRYGKEAQVDITSDGEHAVVIIKDQGPGIPQERLQDVFEPFVRLEESRNEETGGIGLGLAITRSIIHAQGGTIELSNGEEKGLIVTVKLPL